jgi:pimeloyl-ACP methyl ester carboxylesterase
MLTRNVRWQWEGVTVSLGLDGGGSGPCVLLLPALSSISTRAEMHPLMERLVPDFQVATVDWPGFGNLPRDRADWSPAALSAFLDWFLNEITPDTRMIVAAGHAAAYTLHHALRRPDRIERFVLIAPTWRGPLPTVLGAHRPWFARARKAIDLPMIGDLLYRINVSRFVLKKMALGHVYSDPHWLSGDRLAAKLAVTHARGARHASVRFVTGYFDRVESRDAFLDLARRTNKPTLVVYGDETPPRSRAEMEALAALPNVRLERLPKGKLSVHEEFPDDVASVIKPFLMDR